MTLARDPPPPRSARAAERFGTVAGASGVGFVISYVLLRLVGAVWFPEPNPAVIVSSAKVAYFFRLQVSVYVTGMIAIVVSTLPPKASQRLLRSLPAAIAAATCVLVAQAATFP